MIIKNLTQNTILVKDAKIAKSIKDRLFGLLLPSNPESLIFKTRFGIHTFGLKKPVDVIVLDEKMSVVKIKNSFPPNRLLFWNPKFDLVIELPFNSLKDTKINDLIEIT